MKTYIGVKMIEAEPMLEIDFYSDKEFAVGQENREGYKVKYPDGYESWSPKDVFEKAYLPLSGRTGITIDDAVTLIGCTETRFLKNILYTVCDKLDFVYNWAKHGLK